MKCYFVGGSRDRQLLELSINPEDFPLLYMFAIDSLGKIDTNNKEPYRLQVIRTVNKVFYVYTSNTVPIEIAIEEMLNDYVNNT